MPVHYSVKSRASGTYEFEVGIGAKGSIGYFVNKIRHDVVVPESDIVGLFNGERISRDVKIDGEYRHLRVLMEDRFLVVSLNGAVEDSGGKKFRTEFNYQQRREIYQMECFERTVGVSADVQGRKFETMFPLDDIFKALRDATKGVKRVSLELRVKEGRRKPTMRKVEFACLRRGPIQFYFKFDYDQYEMPWVG